MTAYHVNRQSLSALLAAMALLLHPVPSRSATATATIVVTATVLSVCTIVAVPLVFGNYTSSLLDSTTSLSVLCTPTTSYDVGLSAGTGTGATVSSRKMTNGGTVLLYSLYRDAAHTMNWGETVGTDTVGGTGTGLPQIITVYGRIQANQYVGPGVYTDVILATVTY